MSAFYNSINKVVIKLIKQFGKPCVFRAFHRVPNTNPSRPPTVTTSDQTLSAVFTKHHEKETDGIRVLASDMKVLVQGTLSPDFKIDGQIIDPDGVIWKVENIMPVTPGPLCVLFKIQVRI